MVCTHLKDLYQLCHDHQLRLGGSDLVRVVCLQCGQQEVCPSTLMDEYDSRHDETVPPPKPPQSGPSKSETAVETGGSSRTT